uniref:Uncharacterized protein n=1 Tax=mine drainage metagenome TaxID=410659 RepID=E6PI48_9ZZZZ
MRENVRMFGTARIAAAAIAASA